MGDGDEVFDIEAGFDARPAPLSANHDDLFGDVNAGHGAQPRAARSAAQIANATLGGGSQAAASTGGGRSHDLFGARGDLSTVHDDDDMFGEVAEFESEFEGGAQLVAAAQSSAGHDMFDGVFEFEGEFDRGAQLLAAAQSSARAGHDMFDDVVEFEGEFERGAQLVAVAQSSAGHDMFFDDVVECEEGEFERGAQLVAAAQSPARAGHDMFDDAVEFEGELERGAQLVAVAQSSADHDIFDDVAECEEGEFERGAQLVAAAQSTAGRFNAIIEGDSNSAITGVLSTALGLRRFAGDLSAGDADLFDVESCQKKSRIAQPPARAGHDIKRRAGDAEFISTAAVDFDATQKRQHGGVSVMADCYMAARSSSQDSVAISSHTSLRMAESEATLTCRAVETEAQRVSITTTLAARDDASFESSDAHAAYNAMCSAQRDARHDQEMAVRISEENVAAEKNASAMRAETDADAAALRSDLVDSEREKEQWRTECVRLGENLDEVRW